ncbi:MAG TPA: phytanoyl-CoA dioxygenase family protein [Terriglobales bacterium]|nr:phytanoyl-CoA dioxygenase family protein [Terriglobales bacterium]
MWDEQLQNHGLAIIPSVLAPAEIASVIQGLGRVTLPRTRAGTRNALQVDTVAALARSSRVFEIVREILGRDAIPYRATLFEKSPDANWLVAWHQDRAIPLRERRERAGWGPWSVKQGVIYAHAPARVLNQVVALRIHLDDSNSENGPLRVLPGTHLLGILSNEQIEQLTFEVPALDCLVSQGGILAMKPLLVHASSKCRADARRRVLHIEYAASRFVEEGFELATA